MIYYYYTCIPNPQQLKTNFSNELLWAYCVVLYVRWSAGWLLLDLLRVSSRRCTMHPVGWMNACRPSYNKTSPEPWSSPSLTTQALYVCLHIYRQVCKHWDLSHSSTCVYVCARVCSLGWLKESGGGLEEEAAGEGHLSCDLRPQLSPTQRRSVGSCQTLTSGIAFTLKMNEMVDNRKELKHEPIVFNYLCKRHLLIFLCFFSCCCPLWTLLITPQTSFGRVFTGSWHCLFLEYHAGKTFEGGGEVFGPRG